MGVSLWLDAISGYTDRNHRRCRGGVREVSRRAYRYRFADPMDRSADHALAAVRGKPLDTTAGRNHHHFFANDRKHARAGAGEVDPEYLYLRKDTGTGGADRTG